MSFATKSRWLVLLLFAVLPVQAQESEPDYSFIVAGHLYGEPDTRSRGLYAPFMETWRAQFADRDIAFGVFTGDVVSHATEAQWELVDRDIASMGIKVHIAVGNHDVMDRELYEARYGATYYSFRQGSGVFIVLDSELSDGSIAGLQLQFLETALRDITEADHVFLFMHSLVWIVGQERYAKVKPNRVPDRDAKNNFWTEVAPLLKARDRPVYIFGGDLGGSRARDHFVLEQDGNLTFVATGMGSGKEDNFLVVDVYAAGPTEVRKIDLRAKPLP